MHNSTGSMNPLLSESLWEEMIYRLQEKELLMGQTSLLIEDEEIEDIALEMVHYPTLVIERDDGSEVLRVTPRTTK